MLAVGVTASQKAVGKYLFVVMALFVAQVFLGGLTAHYTIEGQGFYGLDLSWLPYSLSRTWHIQSAIFWIATAFLAAGLRSEEHTSELQSLMRSSYAVFCLKKK